MSSVFVKWITCKVEVEQQQDFSIAQQSWNRLAKVPGFLGQLGGWDTKNIGDACILGLWRDKSSYDHFMANVHDNIFDVSSQMSTYSSISVRLFKSVFDMPGVRSSILSSVGEGKYMRVADCEVKPDRVDHFMEAQEKIWIPAMSDSKGMVGGLFSKSIESNEYLVTTIWESLDLHLEYATNKVPGLREKADVSGDIESIMGRFIELQHDWMVVGDRL